MPYFLSREGQDGLVLGCFNGSLCPLSLFIFTDRDRESFLLGWSDLASLGRKEMLALPGRVSEKPGVSGW